MKTVLFDANIFMVGISDRVSDKDYTVDNVARELKDLEEVDIITFDIVLLSAYVYYAERNDNSYSKGLKSMYKKHCSDVIKRGSGAGHHRVYPGGDPEGVLREESQGGEEREYL